MRAIACLIVLQMHLFFNIFTLPKSPNGSVGVDLFFVISGYIIAASAQRLPKTKGALIFFINRLSRVAPYYYLLTLLYSILLIAFAIKIKLNYYIATFLFVPHFGDPIIGVGWTLVHEVFFYSFISLTLIFTNRIKLSALFYLIFLILIRFIPDFAYITTFLKASINFTFAIGMLIFIYESWLTKLFKNYSLIILSISIFLCSYIFTWDNPIDKEQADLLPKTGVYFRDICFIWKINYCFPRFLLQGIPASLFFISLLSLEKKLVNFKDSILIKIGDASYSIYLIQVFPLFFIKILQLSNFFVIVLIFILTLLVSLYMLKIETLVGKMARKFLTNNLIDRKNIR